jgi:hypothetical protein|tara:strand:+ start:356 stop:757 length:402 start_codon:yes stop_codon:yes gene_type:complete
MEHQTKVLKLSNGEEIITVISSADKSRPYIEVKNPLQVNLYPKSLDGGFVESMALSRWLTVSETQIANLNKTSIVAISDASIGLARFYEHCVKKMTLSDNGRVWDEPSDEDLQRIEQEEYDNLIPFPTKDTIH